MTILSFEKDLKSNKYFYLENEIKEKNDTKTIEIDSKKSKLTIKLIKKFETDIIEISSHPYSNSTLNFNTDTIFYIDFKISPEQEKIKISPISPTPFSFVSFAKIKKNQENAKMPRPIFPPKDMIETYDKVGYKKGLSTYPPP